MLENITTNDASFRVGMYGGSFDPLHIGHIHDIIRAAAMCDELHIVISWCDGRESTSKELRYRWMHGSVKHLPNVVIHLLEDRAVSKEEYNTDFFWEQGANDIKNLIGKPIDAVFCGSDYYGTGRFESLYCPESQIVYFDRREVPIASTDIRFESGGHWQYLPPVCRAHYAKRVLIVGGESTGKSTLTQNLALAYNTTYVSEVGRETCECAGGEEYMNADDLIENIVRQKVNEIDAVKHANRILFVDTDALTTEFYAGFLNLDPYSNIVVSGLGSAVVNINRFDLVIFLTPTKEFIQDGTRSEEIASNREYYSDQIRALFDEHDIEYELVGGSYLERFNTAKRLIAERFGIRTVW